MFNSCDVCFPNPVVWSMSHYLQQVMAFVAPKIIGGSAAPSPVGELGMVEMNQALKLSDVTFEQVTNVNCELEVAEM